MAIPNLPDEETLLRGYRVMRAIREFELRISKEFAAGTVPGMTHLYIGQEAIAAGVCAHLSYTDYVASTHRGHGHSLAKGCDIKGMALELFRKAGGICKGKGGSMHIADVEKGMLGANAIVGGAAPLALGAALTARLRRNASVAVAFAGDGATNQGTTFEAMNMAVALKLPLILVIENNGFGEHTGVSYATGNDITERTRGFGMPCEKIDGTDFLAVHAAMGRAVARARSLEGPCAIEAVAYRWHGHYEGDQQAYRDKDELREVIDTQDPLKIFREKCAKSGPLSESILDEIDMELRAEVAEAVDFALLAPQPAPEELLTDVYVSY